MAGRQGRQQHPRPFATPPSHFATNAGQVPGWFPQSLRGAEAAARVLEGLRQSVGVPRQESKPPLRRDSGGFKQKQGNGAGGFGFGMPQRQGATPPLVSADPHEAASRAPKGPKEWGEWRKDMSVVGMSRFAQKDLVWNVWGSIVMTGVNERYRNAVLAAGDTVLNGEMTGSMQPLKWGKGREQVSTPLIHALAAEAFAEAIVRSLGCLGEKSRNMARDLAMAVVERLDVAILSDEASDGDVAEEYEEAAVPVLRQRQPKARGGHPPSIPSSSSSLGRLHRLGVQGDKPKSHAPPPPPLPPAGRGPAGLLGGAERPPPPAPPCRTRTGWPRP